MQKFILFLLIPFTLFAGEMRLPLKFKLDRTFEFNNDFIKKAYIEGTIIAYLPDEFSRGILEVEPFTLNSWITWHDESEFDLRVSAEPIIFYEGTEICDLVLTDFKLHVTEVSSDLLPTKWLLKRIKKLTHKFDEGKFLPKKKADLIRLGNEKFNEYRKDICEDE